MRLYVPTILALPNPLLDEPKLSSEFKKYSVKQTKDVIKRLVDQYFSGIGRLSDKEALISRWWNRLGNEKRDYYDDAYTMFLDYQANRNYSAFPDPDAPDFKSVIDKKLRDQNYMRNERYPSGRSILQILRDNAASQTGDFTISTEQPKSLQDMPFITALYETPTEAAGSFGFAVGAAGEEMFDLEQFIEQSQAAQIRQVTEEDLAEIPVLWYSGNYQIEQDELIVEDARGQSIGITELQLRNIRKEYARLLLLHMGDDNLKLQAQRTGVDRSILTKLFDRYIYVKKADLSRDQLRMMFHMYRGKRRKDTGQVPSAYTISKIRVLESEYNLFHRHPTKEHGGGATAIPRDKPVRFTKQSCSGCADSMYELKNGYYQLRNKPSFCPVHACPTCAVIAKLDNTTAFKIQEKVDEAFASFQQYKVLLEKRAQLNPGIKRNRRRRTLGSSPY